MCSWRDDGVKKKEELYLEEEQAHEAESRTRWSTYIATGSRRSKQNEGSTMSEKIQCMIRTRVVVVMMTHFLAARE